jgi:hypothetical protein
MQTLGSLIRRNLPGMRLLFVAVLLAGCNLTPEQAATVGVGAAVGSIAVIGRSPADAVYSIVSGRDCSIVRLEQNKSYCKPIEPPPSPQPYCTRSLGVVDCWADPEKMPNLPPQVGDIPHGLTPEQEADRVKGWLNF